MVTAQQVVDATLERAPTLGEGRLICIDGPAGSGKTTLADQVTAATGAPVLHLDDFYRGWDGLGEIGPSVAAVLDTLAEGRSATYSRYNWHVQRFVEQCIIDPAPLLVLEGVGAGNRQWAHLATTLVWIEAAPHDCRSRALERAAANGEVGVAEHWDAWKAAEVELHRTEQTRDRADFKVLT